MRIDVSDKLAYVLAGIVVLGVLFYGMPAIQERLGMAIYQCPAGYTWNDEAKRCELIPMQQQQVPEQAGLPAYTCPAGQTFHPDYQTCVRQYATNVYGYVKQYEDHAPINGVSVYATKGEDPFETYLFKEVEAVVEAQDQTDSDGKYELLVLPGETYIWTWPIDLTTEVDDRYPEEVKVDVPDYTLTAYGEQPTWSTSELVMYVRKVGNFTTPLIDDVNVSTGTTSFSGTEQVWNLASDSTAASASTVYWLKDGVDKYMKIRPATTDEYLKDVILKTILVPESAIPKISDLSFSIVSNPLQYPIEVHAVANSAESDYILVYGYMSSRGPLQLNFMVETEDGVTFTEGEDLIKMKLNDMRDRRFAGQWKDDFNQALTFLIEA